MKAFIFGFMVLFFLASCGSAPVKKNAAFNQNSPTGVVVFGLMLSPLASSPIVRFRKYDPVTGVASKKETFYAQFSDQDTGYEKSSQGVFSYFVLNMPAGHWYLENFFTNTSEGMTVTHGSIFFSDQSSAFAVRSGEAQYIGEYLFSVDQFRRTGLSKQPDQLEKATAKLLEFKNINVALVAQKPLTIKYSCVKKMIWVNKYECDPEKINVEVINNKPIK
jgi:hypothetical protein